MPNPRAGQRYIVSNLGFGYAVHDTQVGQEYAFRAGKDKEHKSTNALNTKRLEVFATRAQAQAYADERNAEHERTGE